MSNRAMMNKNYGKLKRATFAGGCFWCMEPPFKKLKGIFDVIPGYSGGDTKDPSYNQVLTGKTGHRESVQILFNPKKTSYEELLEVFWMQIDPTDIGGQFADRGEEYKTAIFYHNKEQKRLAEKSKKELEKSKRFDEPIATEILPYKDFTAAEIYHQDYARKNPVRYKAYKYFSGRDSFLKKKWKDKIKITEERKNG